MSVQELWAPIDDFPRYEVSNYGRVYNAKTGRNMVLSPTQVGDMTVGLVKDGHQYRRSVKLLVARAFVEGEDHVCNTPMLLDCDKGNLRASNIIWRPRWISREYATQFEHPLPWYDSGPIFDLYTQQHYDTIADAAIANGILCREIRRSLLNEVRVYPTGQQFIYLK